MRKWILVWWVWVNSSQAVTLCSFFPCVEQILSQAFMKNLTKCLNSNVHLILYKFWGHLMVSGYKHTNFCNWIKTTCRKLSKTNCTHRILYKSVKTCKQYRLNSICARMQSMFFFHWCRYSWNWVHCMEILYAVLYTNLKKNVEIWTKLYRRVTRRLHSTILTRKCYTASRTVLYNEFYPNSSRHTAMICTNSFTSYVYEPLQRFSDFEHLPDVHSLQHR
jgi:hypothetical protein